MKIRTIIVDDNPSAISLLRRHCEDDPDLEMVEDFLSGEEFLEKEAELDYQLCFLDVKMPGLDGLECAQRLMNKTVVFVSGEKVPAHEVYDIGPLDFVDKPITTKKFAGIMEKVKKHFQDEPGVEFAFFKSDRGKLKVVFAEVLVIRTPDKEKGDSRDKELILTNGERPVLKNVIFDALLEVLPQKDFIQINPQMVINKSAFSSLISKDTIEIQVPDPEIPIKKERMPCTLGNKNREEFLRMVGYDS